MLKKIIVGILLVSVLGAGTAAFAYNAATKGTVSASATPEPLVNAQSTGNGRGWQQTEQTGTGEPALSAQGAVGEPWEATGTISAVDEYGFDLAIEGGETVYIELGPPDFWQSQGVALSLGEAITVTGTNNEGMIHATRVVFSDGRVLQLRAETGQPLWSGGGTNRRGQIDRQGDGEHVPEPQAQVDDWITIQGTLMSFQGGSMTMGTSEGDLITFQTGQPRFFAEQGITFQVGDEIAVLGFYEGDQYMAGEITQVSTGLRVMLRDPNGRPLWAGPGNGNGNRGGSGSNGHRGGGNF